MKSPLSFLLLPVALVCTSTLAAQARHFERDANRTPQAFLTTAGSPLSIVCDDLDGDGRLDIAHAGRPQNLGYYVAISLRRGSGWAETQLPVVNLGALPSVALELIDFDGDGDRDLLARVWAISGPLSLAGAILDYFRNDGAGAFTRVRTTSVYSHTGVRTAAGDVDGDGDQDLVVGYLDERGATTKQLVLAHHDGAFGFAVDLAAIPPVAAFTPELLDLDGDGDLDLLAIDAQGQVIRFDHQNGAFTGGLPVGAAAVLMETGDIDGDGDADVLLQQRDGSLAWLRNGGGALALVPIATPPIIAAAFAPPQLADIDGDGDLDVLSPDYADLRVLRNDGSGGFPALELVPDVRTFGTGDFDRDGAADIVAEGQSRSTLVRGTTRPLTATMDTARLRGTWAQVPFVRGHTALLDVDGNGLLDAVDFWGGVMAVRINRGGMLFDVATAPTPFPFVGGTVVGDFDGDGDSDLAALSGTELQVHRSNGTAALLADPPVQMGTVLAAVAPADVDGDGDEDLVVVDHDAAHWIESLGTSFAAPVALPAQRTTSRMLCVAAADFDGDGDVDVAVGSGTGCVQVLTNDGTGTFTADPCAFTAPFATPLTAMAPADVDGDGDLDLLVATTGPQQLFVNDGAGNFAPSAGLALSGPTTGVDRIHAADFDDDGDVDFAVGSINITWLWLNDGSGRFTNEASSRIAPVDRLRSGSVAGDLDGDGDVDFLRAAEPEVFDNVRSLVSREAPVPGGSLRFAAARDAGFLAAGTFAIPVVALQPRAAPLRVPGIAGLLQVDALQGAVLGGILLPAGAGRAEFAIGVPPLPGLVGVDVFVQCLFLGSRPGWSPLAHERVLWQ